MFARHVALYLAVVEGRISHNEAGRLFDRDRRSVAYAVARIELCRDDDAWLNSTLDRLACALSSADARGFGAPDQTHLNQ